MNKYPWVVALMDATGTQQFCGGTLVASKYVVTAAHCMYTDNAQTQVMTPAQLKIRIGDHDLETVGETSLEKTVSVNKITIHESYGGADLANDITVIELAEELDLNVYTPACMAQTSDSTSFDGKTAQVYGWGTTSFGGASSSKLLEVSVPVISNTQCSAAMGAVAAGQLCAGGQAGKDSCQVSLHNSLISKASVSLNRVILTVLELNSRPQNV